MITIVSSDGTALREHRDDDDAEPTNAAVTKYNEAVSGAEFGIHCELTPPWPAHKVLREFKVDHRYTGGTHCRPSHHSRDPCTGTHAGFTSFVDGQTHLHKFTFAFVALDVGAYRSISIVVDNVADATR